MNRILKKQSDCKEIESLKKKNKILKIFEEKEERVLMNNKELLASDKGQ